MFYRGRECKELLDSYEFAIPAYKNSYNNSQHVLNIYSMGGIFCMQLLILSSQQSYEVAPIRGEETASETLPIAE